MIELSSDHGFEIQQKQKTKQFFSEDQVVQ